MRYEVKKKVRSRKKNFLSNLKWSIIKIHKFRTAYIILMTINACVKGILPAVSLMMTQALIDEIQYRLGTLQNALLFLAILIGTQLIGEIIIIITQTRIENYELEFDAFFQEEILQKVANLDSKDFEDDRIYDLINRTQYDANAGILGAIKSIYAIATNLISVVSFTLIIVRYNILLFFAIIVLPVIRYCFEKRYNLAEYDIEKKNTEPERKGGYISFILTNSETHKEIKLFSLFDFFIKKYKKIKQCCNLKIIKLHNRRAKLFCLLGTFEKCIDLGVTLVILSQTYMGTVSIGKFILLSNSIDSLKDNIVSMFSQMSLIYKNSAMIEQIRAFFEVKTEEINEDGILVDKIKSIKLEHLNYKYRNEDTHVLHDINIEFNNSEFVVFMGQNGSGKTTLMKIIMGLYSDYEGTIYVNGIDLRDLNLIEYRKKVSALFQNYIKYESTISDNIRYGDIDINSNQGIINIMKKVELGEFQNRLSQVLGYQFREGKQISVGQWQKLALARSLYRNADVYIFDEPNASLDLITEGIVLNTIYRESKDKITLLIMHRFNYIVELADSIVVLDSGEITEKGTHAELLRKGGIYHQLYSMQSQIASTCKGND